MTGEVREYAKKRIAEAGIRMVPGHYPNFESREHVDQWLAMSMYISKHWDEEPDLWAFTEIEKNQYTALLAQLKRNKEQVPMEDLRGRYYKAYRKLLKQIKAMTEALLQDMVLQGLLIERIHADELYVQINQAIQGSGLLGEIGHAVYQRKDVEAVLDNVKLLREMVHQVVNNFEERGNKDESQNINARSLHSDRVG